MKLIRFGDKGAEKPGVIVNGERKDCSGHFEDWNQKFFMDDGLERLSQLIDAEGDNLPTVPDTSRWGSCVARPNMIICVGLNYSDHAIESGMDLPREPVIFMKANNTIAGPYDDITIPKNSVKTDWEVELAIVIGKDSLYLESEEEAKDSIAGYCVMNDISEREFQMEREGQWVKGKSCPDFSPVGPYLTTQDEIDNIENLQLKLSVNDKVMQNGNTNKMVFKPYFLVYYISQFMKLEAGDIISTGTPPGVGFGMNPPIYLKPGDLVALSIEGLGEQKQRFIAYN